ncbi:unnamed protein product [Pleuronectes platessa]|uniref:Uncharacterized protein n=1 Tax=Pleuronectes platessa TaxID=8262 RepID=A0A9N7UIR2_PLEPL|nr:unnamed protein product [Pleuronectes platessa]
MQACGERLNPLNLVDIEASWQHAHHNGRETVLLHLYSPGQQLCYRSKRVWGGRKGVREESVPLRSSAVTTPALPGEESAPLTSPRRSAAPRYISSVPP